MNARFLSKKDLVIIFAMGHPGSNNNWIWETNLKVFLLNIL